MNGINCGILKRIRIRKQVEDRKAKRFSKELRNRAKEVMRTLHWRLE